MLGHGRGCMNDLEVGPKKVAFDERTQLLVGSALERLELKRLGLGQGPADVVPSESLKRD